MPNTDASAERLQKVLAAAGVGSRRTCEELIAAGRVTVDGRRASLGDKVDSATAVIHVDGERVVTDATMVYLAMNKPRGVVSTMADERGRAALSDYLRDGDQRVFHVGRLDADSEGLLLLTNDGALAHRLTHPSFQVPRVYRARVARPPVRSAALRVLREGVELDDGRTAPARVRRVRPDVLELTIHEGRKRQVRRMCEAVGHPVLALRRIAFGPLRLDDLAPGAHRRLSAAEVERLRAAGRR
jgi:23S rRNA pseudouridine2605 synthase